MRQRHCFATPPAAKAAIRHCRRLIAVAFDDDIFAASYVIFTTLPLISSPCYAILIYHVTVFVIIAMSTVRHNTLKAICLHIVAMRRYYVMANITLMVMARHRGASATRDVYARRLLPRLRQRYFHA